VKHVVVVDETSRVVGVVSIKDVLAVILAAAPRPAAGSARGAADERA
jgi:CBS domain-containing protein